MAAAESRKELSIVVPCFDEQAGLREFHRRCAAACALALSGDHEIILVDDGSRDSTWQVIRELASFDRHVVGVRLFRNHGHQLAVTAGLSVSRGERVMLIDADLQDPPELLSQLMQEMDNGADVVYGQRIARDGESWFKRVSAAAFYRMLSALTTVPIPRDTGDFRLMSRRVVDALALMPEQHRFIRGMVSWIGGRQVALPYKRNARFAGSSKYPLLKMIRFAVDAITSFSTLPLRIAVWLGVLSAVIAFMVLLYVFVSWIRGHTVPGWTSSVATTSLFSAVQLLVLGTMGEYLGRVYQELKHRPIFHISEFQVGSLSYSAQYDFSLLSPEGKRAVLSQCVSEAAKLTSAAGESLS